MLIVDTEGLTKRANQVLDEHYYRRSHLPTPVYKFSHQWFLAIRIEGNLRVRIPKVQRQIKRARTRGEDHRCRELRLWHQVWQDCLAFERLEARYTGSDGKDEVPL